MLRLRRPYKLSKNADSYPPVASRYILIHVVFSSLQIYKKSSGVIAAAHNMLMLNYVAADEGIYLHKARQSQSKYPH